jgi:uncharacterized membrane protein
MLVIQFIVIKVFNWGPRVAWMVFVAMILMTAIAYLLRLNGNAWRTEEAIARVMAEQ